MKNIFLSIIIPAHNEEKILSSTIHAIENTVKSKDYRIIICDDHSTDKTHQVATSLAKEFSNVTIIKNQGYRGFGNTLMYAMKHATGTYVLPVMADLCDDPNTINKMIAKANEGYEVIVGSRYIRGGTKRNVKNHFKSFCSWFVGQICWYFMGVKTHDSTNAFKMMDRNTVLNLKPTSNDFDISLELTLKLHKKGCKITEVPTVWTDRKKGKSKFRIFNVSKKYVHWIVEN